MPSFTYSPTANSPRSNDVDQNVIPLFDKIECVPAVASAARYGKPLDKITEAILELAEKAGVDSAEIEAVRQISAGAEMAKLRAAERAP